MESTDTDFAARTRLGAELAEAQGFSHTACALRALLEDDIATCHAAPRALPAPVAASSVLDTGARRAGQALPPRRAPAGRLRMGRAAARLGRAVRSAIPGPAAPSK